MDLVQQESKRLHSLLYFAYLLKKVASDKRLFFDGNYICSEHYKYDVRFLQNVKFSYRYLDVIFDNDSILFRINESAKRNFLVDFIDYAGPSDFIVLCSFYGTGFFYKTDHILNILSNSKDYVRVRNNIYIKIPLRDINPLTKLNANFKYSVFKKFFPIIKDIKKAKEYINDFLRKLYSTHPTSVFHIGCFTYDGISSGFFEALEQDYIYSVYSLKGYKPSTVFDNTQYFTVSLLENFSIFKNALFDGFLLFFSDKEKVNKIIDLFPNRTRYIVNPTKDKLLNWIKTYNINSLFCIGDGGRIHDIHNKSKIFFRDVFINE